MPTGLTLMFERYRVLCCSFMTLARIDLHSLLPCSS